MNRTSRFCLTSALNYVITIDIVFSHLCHAILQLQELCHIALTFGNGTTTPTWSIDQGLLFFDGRFYILVTSPLLPDLLKALLLGGPSHMRYLMLGCHPPMTSHHNVTPSGILLGRAWPQGMVSHTMKIFLDDLGHQLLHINIYISLRPNSDRPRLSPDEFNGGDLMSSTMLDLMTMPPSDSTSTIRR